MDFCLGRKKNTPLSPSSQMHLMSVGEAQSGFPIKKINFSVVTGMKVLAISLSQSERLKLYFTPSKTSTLLWQTQGLTVSSTTKQKQVSKNPALSQVMKSIFQLSLRSNLVLLTFFVPSSDNPANRPSRKLSDIDCRLSPMAWTFVQQVYGPHTLDLFASHQMSSAIRMADLFISLPHFQTQVVLVRTSLHKPSVPQRTLMLSRPLSFLAPF